MTIGLISDTHSLWRPEIAQAFAGVTLVIHAGDVGSPSVLEALQTIAPVEAVFGNVDDPYNPALAAERTLDAGGLTIHVSHGNELGRPPTPELMLSRYAGDVVVFGHTHQVATYRDAKGRWAVNPGSAGPRRFRFRPSVARLTIEAGRAGIEIIWLA